MWSRSRSGCTNEAEAAFELTMDVCAANSVRFGHLNRSVKPPLLFEASSSTIEALRCPLIGLTR